MSTRCEHHLDNGLTLLIEELERPAAATHLLLPGGSGVDPAGLEGAGALLGSLLQRGAGQRSTRELSEAFDGLGYRRAVSTGQSATVVTLAGLANRWAEAMALIADVVRRPALPAAEVEPCRQLALQNVIGLDDNPGQKLVIELLSRYFPGPFGRSHVGRVEGLQALDHAALAAHWERIYRPTGAILAVAGGVPVAEVIRTAEVLFGDWSGEPPAPPAPDTTGRVAYEHVPSTTEQVHLGLAYPDTPPGDPQRYHAMMAGMALSGGMGSRLFTEVREKRGLCYSVHARTQSTPGAGYVTVTAGTTTERSSETLEVIAAELARLPGTITPDEVERGRVRLLSTLIMSDESTGSRAARMGNDQHLLGRVRTFEEIRAGIEAVSCDSLNAHLEAQPPGDYTVVTLGSQFSWPAGLQMGGA